MTSHAARTGLIVAANRLPINVTRDCENVFRAEPASGGLITALQPVLRNRGGVWVGWPGISGDAAQTRTVLDQAARSAGFKLVPVQINEDEQQKFYQGFCNEIVWPLFHDLQSLCNFDPGYWRVYQTVNRRYAEVLAQH